MTDIELAIENLERAVLRLREVLLPTAPFDTPEPDQVEVLDLNVRAYNCLLIAGILYVGELTRQTPRDLMRLKNFGPKSLENVREALKERGMCLKGDEGTKI